MLEHHEDRYRDGISNFSETSFNLKSHDLSKLISYYLTHTHKLEW